MNPVRNHMPWCGDPSLSRPEDRCTCDITPEHQAADNSRREAVRLLEEALHLGMNGERAPGGDENWADWFAKIELYLRGVR